MDLKGKRILITGGTGFLGRALAKRLLEEEPASIRLFSRDEVKHHRMQEAFGHDSRLRHLIGDVRDLARLERAMEGVDLVIHAAALKRIDILEYNVEESIKTNILGTLNVVRAALDRGVEKAVFVSTDKACSPVNTYGACKFVGERIFIESNFSKGAKRTQFTCVRYGNVLESTGSVIPFFEGRIEAGQSIPLTDERMTRFIISPEQAVDLILSAIEHGRGGEVFVPRLPSFRIVDLIGILQRKHGSEAPIEHVGIRPGEKIHELLVNESEMARTYRYEDLYVIASQIEKYQAMEHPPYIERGEPIGEEKDLSSADALLEQAEVERLFTEMGLL